MATRLDKEIEQWEASSQVQGLCDGRMGCFIPPGEPCSVGRRKFPIESRHALQLLGETVRKLVVVAPSSADLPTSQLPHRVSDLRP